MNFNSFHLSIVIVMILGTVTASDIGMHHVLNYIELDLQSRSHGSYNHENGKCSWWFFLSPKTFKAMPITFHVKIVRLKVYVIFSQFDDLDLHSSSQLRLKRDKFITCPIIVIYLDDI